MELLFEALFQLMGELLLQVTFELLAELGMRRLKAAVRAPRTPFIAMLGYLLCGAAAGGLSLLLFPASAIHDPALRLLNLIVTPPLMGFAMVRIGKIWATRGHPVMRLDRFGFAFAFALAMALVRYVWAR